MLPPQQRPGPPAREYPFQIDPFQQTAINALEAGHNVLVAAHTSAGKTVVAEYAFAMGLRDRYRVVYTSPLKALSNQKYRELSQEFGDVGLMTGDVTINPGATCLVMTTEILRSMLYRGAEVVREVGLLVYDEVHYLRDAERGVVWEESIILAPKGCRMAFLSATIPNSAEFAGWVAATHGSPVHVVYTEYRPTPLQHYLFPAGAEGLFMVVDERGVFRDDNFQAAVAALQDSTAAAATAKGSGAGGKGKGQAKTGPGSDIFRLVLMVMARGYDPFIVFSFSKRECEGLALSLAGLDLNSADEAALVEGVFRNAVDVLSEEDQRLPQIGALLPMLKRGIGVHHSGLLPILKELVELLFQEGLLKVLFATETFSTGLNMPAKTVAFTRARKWDGGAFRWLRSGEYIQMSGRAGRRGLDDRGIVILMFDTQMEPSIARDMIKGAADPLVSAFSLRYSQLLQLARTEGTTAEMLLQASFRQWQLRHALPQLEQRLAELSAAKDAVAVPQEEQVTSFAELLESRLRLGEALREAVADPAAALRFLQPGRLLRVDGCPPQPERPLPSLGRYTPPQQPADGDADADAVDGDAAAAAAGCGGAGPEVLSRVDSSVWAVLVNFEKAGKHKQQQRQQQGKLSASSAGDASDDDPGPGARGAAAAAGPRFVMDVLVNVDAKTLPGGAGGSGSHSSSSRGQLPTLLPPGAPGSVAVVLSLPLEHLACLSAVRLKALKDLRSAGARQAGLAAAAEVLARYAAATGSTGSSSSGQPPLLDPQQDMQLSGKEVGRLVSRLEALEGRLAGHALWASKALLPGLVALQHKQGLAAAARAAKKELKAAQGLVLADELKARLRVLRRLGYLDGEGLVTAKGRLAAELASGHDELVLSELLLGGAFAELSPDQLVALCSCFVWSEKSSGSKKLPEALAGPLAALRKAARHVGTAAADAKLGVNVDEFVERFRPELMEACAAWTRGQRFADVLNLAPDVFEGSLVRAVRRLEELMRQVAGALRGIGDNELAGRFDDACARVKRDIIFAASLYL
uniref:Helicase ATP-binding domain-containing protein n=1 Tax=Tetradesmus obliquus TaxID=3088 RepID=A0A383W508_TETOB|eukprot:jgi/Sobl393_1/17708/SZX72725.1